MHYKYSLLFASSILLSLLYWTSFNQTSIAENTITLDAKNYTYQTDQFFIHYFYKEQEQATKSVRHLFPNSVSITKPSAVKMLKIVLASPLSDEEFWQKIRTVNALPNLMMTPYFDDGRGGFFSYGDEIMVILKKGASESTLKNSLEKLNIEIAKSSVADERLILLKYPKTELQNIATFIEILRDHPAVHIAQPNYWRIAYPQSDPLLDQQWYLDYDADFDYTMAANCLGISPTVKGVPNQHVKAFEAWEIDAASHPNDEKISGKANGNPIKIAIIDDGVDLTHEDLLANMLPGYDAVYNTLGDNGNYDGENFFGGNGTSDNSHGTGCIGIAAAVGDNDFGGKGVAHGANIISIRAGTKYTDGTDLNLSCNYSDGSSADNDIFTATLLTDMISYAAFEKAIELGADVCTNSWGFSIIVPESYTLEYIVNELVNEGREGKGTPVFFASGNDNLSTGMGYPANLEQAIAVGAVSLDGHRKSAVTFDQAGSGCATCGLTVFEPNSNTINNGIPYDGEMEWGSNYGQGLDVVAPGVRMTTTSPGDNYIDYFNGTSSACPLAAGVMALILDANPNLSSTQARYILEATATKVYEGTDYFYTSNINQPNGSWNNQVGYGRVDALAAVEEANGATCLELAYNESIGSFGDGSISSIDPTVDYNYNNYQTCTWQIQPLNAASITLDFTQFDLAPGDFLEVYESLDDSGQLTTFSSFNEPTSEIFESPHLYIKFLTDRNPNGGLGWQLNYTAEESTVGDNCDEPILISCGQSIESNNGAGGNFIDNYNCVTFNETGPEQVYTFELSEATTVEINLTIHGGEDLDLFLVSACDPDDCIGSSTTSSNELILLNLEAGIFYIIVDGFSGDIDDYTLSLNCDNTTNPFICNNVPSISCGTIINGTLSSGFNQVANYNCVSGLNGPESIYELELAAPTDIDISIAASDDIYVAVLDACDPQSCIAQSTTQVSLNQLDPGTYYVIVDANANNIGSFQLILDCGDGAPDLTYGNVHTINQQGSTISGTASVYNASCNGSAGSSVTNFYLSIDTRVGDGDDELVLSVPTPGLAPDETYVFDYTLSIGDVDPGSYYLFYRVDDTNVVSEAFGNSNTYFWRALDERVLIQDGSKPNITLIHGLSEAFLEGEDLTINVKVTNTEPISAEAFSIGYYVSSDLDVEDTDPFLGELNFNQLGGEQTEDADFSVNINDVLPDLAPGFYSPTLFFDNNFEVNESNGGDNRWIFASAFTQIAINESSYCDEFLILSDNSGTFSDGSEANDYSSNTYCQWLIQPEEEAESITINFDEFYTDSGDDYLRIFSGSSILNTMVAELHGNEGPTSVTINSTRAFIQFSSDDFNNFPGWSASYTSVPKRFCNGLTTLTAASGQFNDGSDCLNYQNNTNCSWLIDPGLPNTQLSLNFEEFALKNLQDHLYVYDGTSVSAPLVAILTGTELPDNLILSSGTAFLEFVTDDDEVDEGFTIQYQVVSGTFDIAGTINREDGVPIPLTSVACSNQDDQLVNDMGMYSFTVPGGVDYLVQPSRNFDWTEGVNVLDYILVQQHIVGNPLLDSPYKIIAADVNRSGAVTTADALLIYQLVLGNITEFPFNESWRFIDANHIFTNPTNPWVDNFPEHLDFDNLNQDWSGQNFVAVKVGDVNNEANGDIFGLNTESRPILNLQGDYQSIAAGKTRNLQLRLKKEISLQALQASLRIDPRYLQLINLSSDVLPNFDADQFGKYDRDTGELRFVWLPQNEDVSSVLLPAGTNLLTLKVTANDNISDWRNAITFAPLDEFSNFVVDQNYQKQHLAIEWSQPSKSLELKANPNPFMAETQVVYMLPKIGKAKMLVLSINGKILKEINLPAAKRGEITLEQAIFPGAGTYLVELVMEDESKTIQIIHLQ